MDLAKLQSHAGSSNTSRSQAGHSQHRSNANPQSQSGDPGQELLPTSPEFHQIREMETFITQIHSNNEEIQSLCSKTARAGSKSKEDSIFALLSTLRHSNNTLLSSLKTALKTFYDSLSSPNSPNDPTDTKIYSENYAALRASYTQVLTEYRNIEFELKDIKTKKIKRQVGLM
jgi:t-SNARE complex subunit (syntaxin)